MRLSDAFFNIFCAGLSCTANDCAMRKPGGGCRVADVPPQGNAEFANIARRVYRKRIGNALLPSAKRRLDESMEIINKAYPPSAKVV